MEHDILTASTGKNHVQTKQNNGDKSPNEAHSHTKHTCVCVYLPDENALIWKLVNLSAKMRTFNRVKVSCSSMLDI